MSKKFYNKCSENCRSQIVFRTDIFRKLSLGAPAEWSHLNNFGVFANPAYHIGLLCTHRNSDFHAISVMEQSCSAPISKVESHSLRGRRKKGRERGRGRGREKS